MAGCASLSRPTGWLVFLSAGGLRVLVGIFTTTKTGNDPIKKEIVATGDLRRLLHPDQDCAGGSMQLGAFGI